jgi:hypothetical protein
MKEKPRVFALGRAVALFKSYTYCTIGLKPRIISADVLHISFLVATE